MTTKTKTKKPAKKSTAVKSLIPHISNGDADSRSGQLNSPIALSLSNLPALPDVAMPGILGEIVRAACKRSETHPVTVLLHVMLRIAVLVNQIYIKIGDAKIHCSPNAVIVGNSSKSWKATSVSALDTIFDGIFDKVQSLHGHLFSGEILVKAVGISAKLHGNGHKIQDDSDYVDPNKRLFFHEHEIRSALAHAKRSGGTLLQIISGLFNCGYAEYPLKSGNITANGAHVVILANTCCTRAVLHAVIK